MAAHRCFTLPTDIQIYFCDSKGINLADVSQAKLDAVARKLNERPRKMLGYEKSAERCRQAVASID